MSTRTIAIVGALGVLAFVLYRNRGALGLDPAAARLDAARRAIGVLPGELTWKERAAMSDRSLTQNVVNYASQGSVGGYWGAAGGALVGLGVELFD